jgi:ketosteroid isomerase-like protein
MEKDLKGNPFKAFEITSLELRIEGSLAIETARFTASAVDALGGRSSITQRFLTVWKRQADGAWRIQTQMGQVESRSPAPAPAPVPAAPK